MAERSAIEWTDATFNPWWGCTEIGPACDNCYARTWAHRLGYPWGLGAPRREFGEAHWREPLKWARKLPGELGRRPRVFCASMADVFDKDAPRGARERLWNLIYATPELDWLLLTKRIGNAQRMLPAEWAAGTCVPPNVWLGATVVTQEEADRDIPKLLNTPAAVRFLSMEPLLGPVDLTKLTRNGTLGDDWVYYDNALTGFNAHKNGGWNGPRIDWVIAGFESGPHARPGNPSWLRSLRDQCSAAGVAFHFKQWGEWAPDCLCPKRGTLDYKAHCRTIERPAPGSRGVMFRCGKKHSGRHLDGCLHDEFPNKFSGRNR